MASKRAWFELARICGEARKDVRAGQDHVCRGNSCPTTKGSEDIVSRNVRDFGYEGLPAASARREPSIPVSAVQTRNRASWFHLGPLGRMSRGDMQHACVVKQGQLHPAVLLSRGGPQAGS